MPIPDDKTLSQLVSATAALDFIQTQKHALIDVRSEGEFAKGSVPGFENAPILNDAQRHQVGLTYKTAGQAAAVALGEKLVGPFTAQRLASWKRIASGKSLAALVMCWRGGMRSQLVCERLAAVGCATMRVAGGYKALRSELLDTLASPPPLLVVGGLTGSGKTRLLATLPVAEKIDLEEIAAHRGSSFGRLFDRSQPSQATFENTVALALRSVKRPVVIEDESERIGQVRLPNAFYQRKQEAPVVWIETDLQDRSRNIFAEYLEAPLAAGFSPSELAVALAAGIQRLKRRLGGALAQDIELGVTSALSGGRVDFASHAPWIEALLTTYYDKSYLYAFARVKREVLFRGNFEECRQWILHRYA
jgi:tRNA 2-selenouridine synthase